MREPHTKQQRLTLRQISLVSIDVIVPISIEGNMTGKTYVNLHIS